MYVEEQEYSSRIRREIKKVMKTLCEKVRKVNRKISMNKPDEERGDGGRIKVGQRVRGKKRPVADVESKTVVGKVRRRGKVQEAVIGDSMIKQAAG